MIQTRRVYEPIDSSDGRRFLVDRVWPRGLKKEALQLDGWIKEVAPSTALRKWFDHDPKKWPEFQKRYLRELAGHAADLQPLVAAALAGGLTLLFGARDVEHNNAVVLQKLLLRKTRQKSSKQKK
jgi:uncharacterized protein YeaO (DUF488 family)